MIDMITAKTDEIDDVTLAVAQILEQLDIQRNMRAYTVGIVTCYSEFVESGVVKALCEQLPFDVVGTTTIGSAVPGELGQLLLAMTMLTSDDVRFAAGISRSLLEEQRAPLEAAYHAVADPLPETPSLLIGFQPLLRQLGGDEIIEMLNDITGGVPIFGTVTVDHTNDYATARVLYNGIATDDAFAFVLLCGALSPRFYIASVPPVSIRKQNAIITKAQSNVVQEINGMPTLAYLQSLGLSQSGDVEGINAIPFIIDYRDGTMPIARAIFAITQEGYAVCGGVMPEGASLSIGSIDHGDVIDATTHIMREVRQSGKQNALIFSCIGRNMALGVDTLAEMEAIESELTDGVAYHFAYSGGELCPVYMVDGQTANRFHNDTIVVCAL